MHSRLLGSVAQFAGAAFMVNCWWDAQYIGIPESYPTKVTNGTILLAVTPFNIAKYSPVT